MADFHHSMGPVLRRHLDPSEAPDPRTRLRCLQGVPLRIELTHADAMHPGNVCW